MIQAEHKPSSKIVDDVILSNYIAETFYATETLTQNYNMIYFLCVLISSSLPPQSILISFIFRLFSIFYLMMIVQRLKPPALNIQTTLYMIL